MLNLHSGGELVTYDVLHDLKTPESTATHVPLPHFRLVDLVRTTLGMFGHQVVEEHHAIDGARYFGLMTLESPYTGYRDTVGLRNSHDKSLPVGVAFGSSVFVCSNLAFIGDHVIRTKHTANLKSRLPGIIMELIEPLAEVRERQARTIELYKRTELPDQAADHAIMQLYKNGVINVTRIADVVREFEEPTFEYEGGRSAWRLMNAVTFVLEGKIAEKPSTTGTLHRVLDSVCERIH